MLKKISFSPSGLVLGATRLRGLPSQPAAARGLGATAPRQRGFRLASFYLPSCLRLAWSFSFPLFAVDVIILLILAVSCGLVQIRFKIRFTR